MKKVPLVFMTLASLAMAYLHGDIPAAEETKPIPELAFVTYVADPGQERAAGMLIDSIRTWGGEYRNALIWVVLTDPEHAPGTRLAGKNVELLPQRLDAAIRNYPFAVKAFAAAAVEGMIAGKVRSLAWFDPETLLLRPPVAMDLKGAAAAAVNPVHLNNGIGQRESEPADVFWSALYRSYHLDPQKIFGVESLVDGKKVRAYLNCGIFAVQPERGLLREWAQRLDAFLHDRQFQRTACADQLHQLFLHQAVFTVVLVARLSREQIQLLPRQYGYPLHLHGKMPVEKKAKSLDSLVSVFHESLWQGNPAWMDMLPAATENIRHWLADEYSARIVEQEQKSVSFLQAGEIHDAVQAGDLAKIKTLLARDPKAVNEKDALGRNPLHFASYAGNMEIVAFLIANKADVKAADRDGFTPLHWAASAGQAEAARALIAAGADPNALAGPGITTLESAFYGRHPEAVAALLEGGVHVEVKGEAGRALLHKAAAAGFLSLVEYLLANGVDVMSKRDSGGTLLHSAAAGGLSELVRKLLDSGANVNAQDDLGQSPLHLAAAASHQETVELLIARGADIKAVCRDGRNLLHCAAAGGLVGLMERLIKAGFAVDGPDRYGRTPLHKAAEAGSDRAAEFLLAKDAKVMSRDYYDQTPLHEATFSGNLRLLDILVKYGADVQATNEEGSTPLLYVSQTGRAEVIDWLLAHGAKLAVRNKFNETPLTFPLGNGFQEIVAKLWPRAEALKNRELLEKYPLHRVAYLGITQAAKFLLGKGLPIDQLDESGRTPFQRAVQGGGLEIAQIMLAKGAKVDAADPDGSTPLHLAVKKGHTDMVRFLLQKGAGLEAKDRQGRTPLDLAGEYSFPEIARILQDAGAKPTSGSEARDVATLLAKPLRNGEAIVWSLGHCGFAIKTRTRLLIFDYFSRGWKCPEKPSLANGFVDPEEIKNLEVVVFVSHAHGDHFDPVILSWQSTLKNIQYVLGWKAGKGGQAIDLPAPRATTTIKGMEVFTINCEHNDVPEVAYLVKVDGLSICHSGDYMGPIDSYQSDMDYFLKKAGKIDIAFIGKFKQAASLKPKVVFPMHVYNREFMLGAFAREAEEKKLPSLVICPENKGDRFMLLLPEARTTKDDSISIKQLSVK